MSRRRWPRCASARWAYYWPLTSEGWGPGTTNLSRDGGLRVRFADHCDLGSLQTRTGGIDSSLARCSSQLRLYFSVQRSSTAEVVPDACPFGAVATVDDGYWRTLDRETAGQRFTLNRQLSIRLLVNRWLGVRVPSPAHIYAALQQVEPRVRSRAVDLAQGGAARPVAIRGCYLASRGSSAAAAQMDNRLAAMSTAKSSGRLAEVPMSRPRRPSTS